MTLASAAILALFTLIVGIEIGLWLGEKIDPEQITLDNPPLIPTDRDDIDWDNAS